MLESIEYTPDAYFYHCSAIDLYTKIVEYNLLPSGLIENDLVKECSSYLINEPYRSGPIFPFLLLISYILKLGFFLNLIHISVFGTIYFLLLNKFFNLIKIKNKKRIIASILISPIFLWLIIYPSTDIISSIFILIGMICIGQIYRRYKDKNLDNKSFKKTNLIFLSSVFLSLLCRPMMFILIPILIIFYFFSWVLEEKNKKDKILFNQFLYSKYLYYLLFSFTFFGLMSYRLYSNYSDIPFPDNQFKLHGLLFETYSPPAPQSLKEITHKSFSQFYSLLIENISFQKIGLLETFKQFLYFILSVVYSLIFSLLSLSGFQTSVFNEENISLFRYIFSTYKICFGLFINLPGILILYLEGFDALKNFFKKPGNFLNNEENIFKIFIIIAMFYSTSLLFTIGHIRYLLPISPVLVASSFLFWNRMLLIYKK